MNFEILSFIMRAEAAASEAAETAEQVDMGGMFIYYAVMLIVVFGMMYFIAIRPQKKKEKEAKEMRDNLQIGDEVTTIGGIVGIIVRKNDDTDTVVIETGGDRSKIRLKTWAISENATIHDAPEEIAVKKK